jgi:hypothetical protein
MKSKVSKYTKNKKTVILVSYEEPKNFQKNARMASCLVANIIAPRIFEYKQIRIGQASGYLLRDKLAIEGEEYMEKYIHNKVQNNEQIDIQGYLTIVGPMVEKWLESEEFKQWLEFDKQYGIKYLFIPFLLLNTKEL